MFEVLIWWLTTLIIGVGFFPLTSRLFGKFRDGGWIFSKSIGIFVSGYLYWLLSCGKILKFTSFNCIMVLFVCILINAAAGYYLYKKDKKLPNVSWKLIAIEEVLFFAVYAFWSYAICFRPEAYGTEKFMDYAFMTSMMRADYLPPVDPWYAGEAINYYYGGQYLAVFLTKVSGISVGSAYNLMRTLIAAFAFAMPFSMVYQLVERLQIHNRKAVNNKWCMLGGTLSGMAVAFCGNMHYVIYHMIVPVVEQMTGKEINNYFFSNSTRYIGHNPVVEGDNTIHEFPSYSFVLGDLHAHMINIMFVLVVLGLALAWALRIEKKEEELNLKQALLQPEILMIGFFTGMFRWTNFWDLPIYFVAGGCVVFFLNIRMYRESLKKFLVITAAQAAEVLVVGMIVSLPFTLSFDKIASSIKLAYTHSAFYQLVVLWGLPAVIVITFLVKCIRKYLKNKKANAKPSLVGFFSEIAVEDLFIFLMGLCALGLILMPEVIYVEDIYTTAPRANTMFKLTYQGYILFAICMGYILTKGLMFGRKVLYGASIAGTICLVLTAGYTWTAMDQFYGGITDMSRMEGTDASIYVSQSFESDFDAICWMNENIEGQPVILEANGDSYSDYARVSVATGLPTVLGWYVHEWLWRNDTDELNVRTSEIKNIYTSSDRDEVEELIEKYDISYIYVGRLEREKFSDINEELLQQLGEVVYSDGEETYIIKTA